MNQNNIRVYWNQSFDTLYESYYQELLSEALIGRWHWIDSITTFLIAVTASGSAIIGWSLWDTTSGRYGWAIIAGIASLASIAHGTMGVTSRIKEQEELRHMFLKLRIDLETFRQQLQITSDSENVENQYNNFRDRFRECMGKTNPDIALTIGIRKKVQHKINGIMKEKGYIE